MAAAAVEHRTYGSEPSMYVRSTRRVNGVALLAIISPYWLHGNLQVDPI